MALCLACTALHGQTLQQYIEAAHEHSPLIKDYNNRCVAEQSELERLRAVYTLSRLELTGDYLFVPIIAQDNGRTAMKWNAQSATDYYGYDLGESSGHLHAGLTWTKPLLGASSYKAAKEASEIQTAAYQHYAKMEKHQLERTVTEHYLLCLLDAGQVRLCDSIDSILQRHGRVVALMAKNGLAKQSDVRLVDIEKAANSEQRIAARQSYRSHLADLNLVCGISDTAEATLHGIEAVMQQPCAGGSAFAEQYRLDSLAAMADLRLYDMQYRPKLNLFVDGGLRVGDFAQAYRHFGWSAGLTFSMTLFDGRQRKQKKAQTQARLNTIANYRSDAERQRLLRLGQCVDEWKHYTDRLAEAQRQLDEYSGVLQDYEKEAKAGQLSVIDYITVLKSMVQQQRQLLTLRANRQMVAVAYNYWNY